MGQRITVDTAPMGPVALFTLDRSLTGQDGVTYQAGSDDGEGPPRVLADRLFAGDGEIDHVHLQSNSVTVHRRESWDRRALDRAADIIANLFIHYDAATPYGEDPWEAMRVEHYNATITDIRAQNDDLWVIRVTPDTPIEPFEAGQYTTLALGYWEPRADEADEDLTTIKEKKLARRSYSVSSSMVDESGELLPPHTEYVEFYIVKVRPGQEEIPALTPRLFLKGVGDRIFMGRKFAGRYTLARVEPEDDIVFLSTGTGEAPHNAMIAELLRRGHRGGILNAVCVRYRSDLAYTGQHALLTDRYPGYRYLTLTTREPENEGHKVYIQDLVESGRIEDELGAPLDPSRAHVYLCGNPAMIGLPKWEGDTPIFPEPLGVCQQLHDRGFTIDRIRAPGNVHYEEFWSGR
ncbi:MAG TPA: ferredoxin--NADP reductase [Acidimicrobiia bacterium]